MNSLLRKPRHLLTGLLFASMLFVAVLQVGVTHAQGTVEHDGMGNPIDPSANCRQYLLTFPAWYRGIVDTSTCDIKSPTAVGGIGSFIWTIALNSIEILLNLIGYAAVGFIIYGGYKYMISAGSPDGMVAARKTILNAVIGLAISIAAVAIVRTISVGIGLGG